ncbi:hypothetical protein [uncultured Microbulbifer sp.]|uniref:hypothetical protein n=1 Tax=uncultured Microbulbifer sp. TaxID=348147 RepID=UPI0026324C2A|nr:hypothetical protein [uncultured Microbulbifer sp.]
MKYEWNFFKFFILLFFIVTLAACGGGSSGSKAKTGEASEDAEAAPEAKTFAVALSTVVVQQMSTGRNIEVNTEKVVSQTMEYSY